MHHGRHTRHPFRMRNIHAYAASFLFAALVAISAALTIVSPALAADTNDRQAPQTPADTPPPPSVSPPAPAAPQTPTASPAAPAPPPKQASPAETPAMILNGQHVESILGKKVRGTSGDDMGRIIDILADKTGQVRAAIIDFGGFLGVGSRQIAVDWKAIRFPADGKADAVIVDLTKDQLRTAPVYKPGEQIVVLGQQPASPPQTPPAPAPQPAPDTVNPVAKDPPSH